MKECPKHGFQEYDRWGKCKKCRVESTTLCRQNKKKKLVEYKGGKCSICGYDKCQDALTFHHRDSEIKDFTITDKKHYSLERLKKEVDKCTLVCFNCHIEIHFNEDNQ